MWLEAVPSDHKKMMEQRASGQPHLFFGPKDRRNYFRRKRKGWLIKQINNYKQLSIKRIREIISMIARHQIAVTRQMNFSPRKTEG